jgi:hypothetical protein
VLRRASSTTNHFYNLAYRNELRQAFFVAQDLKLLLLFSGELPEKVEKSGLKTPRLKSCCRLNLQDATLL